MTLPTTPKNATIVLQVRKTAELSRKSSPPRTPTRRSSCSGADAVPLTGAGERLATLDLTDLEHPRLKAPAPALDEVMAETGGGHGVLGMLGCCRRPRTPGMRGMMFDSGNARGPLAD